VTILLDVSAEKGLGRARRRNRAEIAQQKEGRFEREALQFHQRVRRGYLEMARRSPDRFVVVPAEGSRNRVHELVWAALAEACDLKPLRRRK
jgi:dTMP kinase